MASIVSDRLDQVATALTELGAGDPADFRGALREYDVRDIIAVLATNLATTGNGGGAEAVTWAGPFTIAAADVAAAYGSMQQGVLGLNYYVPVALGYTTVPGTLIVDLAASVAVAFDGDAGSGATNLCAGLPMNDDTFTNVFTVTKGFISDVPDVGDANIAFGTDGAGNGGRDFRDASGATEDWAPGIVSGAVGLYAMYAVADNTSPDPPSVGQHDFYIAVATPAAP